MIKTFACPETEKIAKGQRSHKLPSDIQIVARRKLSYLKNAKTLQDLRIPPANRLEALQGARRGHTAFASMISGVSVLCGATATLTTLRWWIITERTPCT